MSSRASLSLRLHRLVQLCGAGETLWDIGCDHGLAGREAGSSGAFKHVCFADPSIPVINKLKQTLDSHIPKGFSFSIIQARGDQLKISSHQNVFLMAGLGGWAIISCLKNILPQLSSPARFVLSPHKNTLDVREFLHAGEWHLVSEECLEEDGQFYEIIVVENRLGAQVSLYGEELWERPTGVERRRRLLQKLPLHQSTQDRAFCDFLITLQNTSKST